MVKTINLQMQIGNSGEYLAWGLVRSLHLPYSTLRLRCAMAE